MKWCLLRECGRSHGERHGLWHLLGVEGEWWRVVHAVLDGPLVGSKLLVLIALVSVPTRLIAEVTLSVIAVTPAAKAATAAAIVTTRSILSFVSKHLLLPIRVTVAVILAVAVEVPPAARVAIAAVIPIPSTSTSPGTTSSVFGHLDELGVYGLVGLAEDRDEVVSLFHVVGRKESVGRAGFLTASRTANAVNVVLGIVGVVIVNDKFDVLHI